MTFSNIPNEPKSREIFKEMRTFNVLPKWPIPNTGTPVLEVMTFTILE